MTLPTQTSIPLALLAIAILAPRPAAAVAIPPGGSDLVAGAKLTTMVPAAIGTGEQLADGRARIRVAHADAARAYAAQFAVACPAAAIRKGERILAVIRTGVRRRFRPAHGQAAERESALPFHRAHARVRPRSHDGTIIRSCSSPTRAFRVARRRWCCSAGSKCSRSRYSGCRCYSIRRARKSAISLTYPAVTPAASLTPRGAARALDRIERMRKAELGRNDCQRPGASPCGMPKSASRFAAMPSASAAQVSLHCLLDDGADRRKYREIVDRYCSAVVFENELKDFAWPANLDAARRAARNKALDRAFAWLAERHIAVRGHYLMQVAVPPNLHGVKDPAQIRNHFFAATRERLEFVGDRVCQWDAINHPVAWGARRCSMRCPAWSISTARCWRWPVRSRSGRCL